MLTDEQFGQELGEALRRELADVHASSPQLLRALHRRQARRRWAIGSAIAVPVAAAAVIAVAVMTAGHGAIDGGRVAQPTSTTTSAVPVENLAHVQAQTLKAIGQAADYVIYSKNTYSTGYYEIWMDKATKRTRVDTHTQLPPPTKVPEGTQMTVPPREPTLGPMRLQQSNTVSGPEGDQATVWVDYDLRKWSTGRMTDKHGPSPIPDITDADSIRAAVANGTLQLVGKETVDGLDTLHLQLIGPQRMYRIDMWVDVKTYLPVQEIAVKSGGGTGEAEFPAAHAVTAKYDWLPRTEENLARLVLTAPPGFERVP